MNRAWLIFAASFFLTLAAGCIPEKRIAWSPDGQRAVVMSEQGLYFIDADGTLLAARLSVANARCEWFPDGGRLLVKHPVKARSWSEVAPLFTENEITRIKAEAGTLRERILAYTGDWDNFKFEPKADLSPGMTVAIILYVRDCLSEGLPEKLGEKWQDVKGMEADVWSLQVFAFSPTELVPGDVLLRTLEPLSTISVSPTAKVVAYVAPASSKDATAALHVLPVGGGPSRIIASGVASRYDWSPDGRSLAYIRSMTPLAGGEDNVQLGTLTTVTIAGPDGELSNEALAPQDRVGLLFSSHLDVHWLADGRILFTSVEMTLPATTRDMPQQWTLFALDPKMPASVIRVLGRDLSEPLDAGWPTVLPSPDGRRVLLPGPQGAWTLYGIESGRTTVVVAAGKNNEQQYSLPVWRSNAEVCLVIPVPVEGATELPRQVTLWSEGQPMKSLSDSWPEEVLEGPTSSDK